LRHPHPPAYGPSTDTSGRGVPALSPKAVAPQLIATAPSMVTLALRHGAAARSPGAAVTDMAQLKPQGYCKSPSKLERSLF